MGPPEGRAERLSTVKPEVVARVREVGLSIHYDVLTMTARFQLFEQRPIWTRVALLSQLTVEEVRAVNKCVLSVVL